MLILKLSDIRWPWSGKSIFSSCWNVKSGINLIKIKMKSSKWDVKNNEDGMDENEWIGYNQRVFGGNGPWPNPTQAFSWPAVNKRLICPCAFWPSPDFFWPEGKKLINSRFLGEIFQTQTKDSDPTRFVSKVFDPDPIPSFRFKPHQLEEVWSFCSFSHS